MNEEQKRLYMKRAIALAKKGEGFVNPNPLVGALIIKNGKIIGEGYHQQYGGPHAEVNAFNHASEDVSGATMFVTLEPCAHYGKTPPCALKIIEKKIKKVIIAKLDPNPLVNHQGVDMLEKAGIEVEYGLLADEVSEQNEIFLKYITEKLPFVAIKYAMTLDGKIATSSGNSKWITNEKSRRHVHQLRHKYQAIMVGVNTIIQDDSHLDTRLEKPSRHPIRIIIDPSLRIPRNAYVIKTAKTIPTWIVTEKLDPYLIEMGVRLIKMDRINLRELMIRLGEEKIDSVLIEGGAHTHAMALKAGIVDKVYAYIAPKLIGGHDAPGPIQSLGLNTMQAALKLTNVKHHQFGEDILIEGYIEKVKNNG